jgi:fluoroacetyl-CoA thioesterase
MDSKLTIGLHAKKEQTVQLKDTAKEIGSGLAEVFSTPSMIALMENAAYTAVQSELEQGQSTVGVGINVKHLSATPIGMKVWAVATLVDTDRRRLSFKIEAFDEKEKIGEANHDRFIIDAEKFIQKTYEKADA